ncbi:hypothetical protein AA0119_g9928 [Alternaria tenuissima]|jgi:hypothetical protein|uniref:Uncharacterized protein n=1 Tax=Alternaria tenuissima TaxID=119927 RepID=A0A4Q4P617_9PLEO|nr:hypothetical protein B0T12DRAFT_351733 [Alternaria alternata]RYN22692.1 hypothetical protein AA0115_g9038 [Alternaria tenuissima]RYN50645.1 hypothetical protein AA0118_g10857 [Alternaria tenuissima]RYN92985.1 hypothetical protein AA0119_g9928 [Alternaria tenuissima]RYO45803.1 hypothetical protein AA0116_g13026 [Alternaria tenuissima]
MAPNNSRHLLPMNSVLFHNKSSSHFSLSDPADLTLVNLQDAQDTTVTALPQPPTNTAITAKPAKDSLWTRVLVKLKIVLCFKHGKDEQEDKKEDEKEMCIGEPTGFKHVRTAGPRPMMASVPVVVEEEESEWEDMRESEAGDSMWSKR